MRARCGVPEFTLKLWGDAHDHSGQPRLWCCWCGCRRWQAPVLVLLLRLMLMLRSSWVCWDDMMMKLQARAAAYLLPVEG